MRCVRTILSLSLAACGGAEATDAGGDEAIACQIAAELETGDPDGHARPLEVAEGEARAGRLRSEDLPPDPEALASWRAGDFVLANEHIALVIEDARVSDDFNPYGGQPVGVALTEAGALSRPALFGELSLTWGRTTIATERVSVIADGTDGGAAIVRAEGPLASLGFLDFLSGVIGDDVVPEIRVAMDYVLAPGTPYAEVRVHLLNPGERNVVFREPLLVSVQQNRMPKMAPGYGFEVPTGAAVPWTAFVDEDGASYAYAPEGGPLRVFLEQANFLFLQMPRFAAPACAISERTLGRIYVGGPGLDGLVTAISQATESPLERVEGNVESDGEPASEARVYAFDSAGALISRTTSGSDGRFTLHVPPGPVTLRAWRRSEGASAEVPVTAPAADARLSLAASGLTEVEITSTDGQALGALVQLIPAEAPVEPPEAWGERPIVAGRAAVAYAASGRATLRAPRGPHTLVVSRGYEYEMVSREIEVGPSPVSESVVLEHTVPTPGVMCGDFHIHTRRSFDAEDDERLKVRAAVAEGVEIPARSDHEWVRGFEPVIRELGLEDEVFGIASLELTTFDYGHFGVFPLNPDPGQRNGGAIEWVGRPAIDVLTEARSRESAAGRSELIINHPRSPLSLLGYFTAVAYDPATGSVARPDLWYDEFTLLEVFNGSDFDANRDGVVADWFSFLSRGRRVMAVGSSDTHEVAGEPMGYPRTCMELGLDTASELRLAGAGVVRDAMTAGASTIVGGIFLDVRSGGVGPGGVVTGAGPTAELEVSVRAASWVAVDRVRVFVDGEVVAERALDGTEADPLEPTLRFSETFAVPVGPTESWAVVVADGPGTLAPVHARRRPFGVTNPVFFAR